MSRSAAFMMLLIATGPASAAWFQRGDVDGSGAKNIVDPLLILRALFHADQVQLPCREAADVDDNGQIELTDAIGLLQYLFVNGPRPWPESLLPGCTINRTGDSIGCDRFPACSPRAVFYVIDKSGSMATGSLLTAIRSEASQGLAQLSADDQFAVLFFDSSLSKFPASGDPASATEEMKAEGINFLENSTIGHGTCPKPALLGALAYAEKSTAPQKEIVFISDGYAYCGGADLETYSTEILAEVRERNTGGVTIHSIAVGFDRNDRFLQQLADQNGGSFAILRTP